MIRCFLVFVMLSVSPLTLAATESPYAGQQQRDIKALSQADVDGYLAGEGMGFAKAAELNRYPGPRHVLDLAEELELSEKQVAASQAIFDDMQSKAMQLGEQLVAKERALDQLFASESVDTESLQRAVAETEEIRGQLRFVHLNAHLEQRALLTPHQVMRYVQLRGYGGAHHGDHHAQH